MVKNKPEKINETGRTKNVKIKFIGNEIPNLFVQRIRSKFKIPILIRPSPPKHPGTEPEDKQTTAWKKWNARCKNFVTFYSILFLPFDSENTPRDPTQPELAPILPYNENSWQLFNAIFSSWRKKPESPTQNWYKRSTHNIFRNIESKLDVSNHERKLLNNRYSQVFGKKPEQKSPKKSKKEKKENVDISDLIDMLRAQSGVDKFSTALKSELHLDKFNAKLENVFERIYKPCDHNNKVPSTTPAIIPENEYTSEECEKLLKQIRKNVRQEKKEQEKNLEQKLENIIQNPSDDLVESELPKNMSNGQTKAIAKIKKMMHKKSTQFCALLHGPPGAGKSTVVRMLKKELSTPTSTPIILQTATTGIAATELTDGMTIHSLLKWARNWDYIKLPEKLASKDRLRLHRILSKVDLLVIDECSMLTAAALSRLDSRLRQILNQDTHFGGLNILLVGDFFQLPPASRSPSLFEAAVRTGLGTEFSNANATAHIFLKNSFSFHLKDKNDALIANTKT